MSIPGRTRARTRRSPLRGIVVFAVVLAVLLVLADRGGDAIAENVAATTLLRSQQLDSRPSVTIAGFPFLNQLATGHYDEIRVRANGVRVGNDAGRLRVSRIDVTLRDVTVARNFRSGRATSVSASALISYADLSSALDARFTYAGGGRVRATASVSVLGVDVSGSATAAVRLSGADLSFADQQIEIAGADIPQPVTAFFADLFARSISLAGLPFGVQVRGLRADGSGVGIDLTADGLTFSR